MVFWFITWLLQSFLALELESEGPKSDNFASYLIEFLLTELPPSGIGPQWLSKDITVQVAKLLLVIGHSKNTLHYANNTPA